MAEKKKAGFFRRTVDKVRKKIAPTFDEQFSKAKKVFLVVTQASNGNFRNWESRPC